MSIKNDHLAPRATPLAVGDVAPDFTLLDQDRKEWKLSEAVKKGDVVLSFVPLAFTGVCGTEMGCIAKDAATWQGKGATVVGISCDSFATQKAWAEKEGYTQRLLADMHRQVCKAYGLYWADLNVSQRGTVIIGKSADGKGKVKSSQAREPGKAMDWDSVLASL
jgi:peroxiredoxin